MMASSQNTIQSSSGFLKHVAYLQAFGIILVVFGHSFHESPFGYNWWVYKMMYSFRMPLFLFVSGYLMVYTSIIRGRYKRTPLSFCANKFKRLLIPFIFISTVTFLPRILLSQLADDPISLSAGVFLRSFFYYDSLVIPFYWFLQASFALLCLSYLMLWIFRRHDAIFFILPVVSLGIYMFVDAGTFWSLCNVVKFGVFFTSGVLFGRYASTVDKYINWTSLPLMTVLIVLWALLFFITKDSKWIVICSFFGILWCISLSKILEARNIRVLDHLMGANYLIFLLSWFFNIGSQQVLHHFTDMPWWIYTSLSLLTGIYGPWYIYKTLQRNADKPSVRRIGFLLGQSFKKSKALSADAVMDRLGEGSCEQLRLRLGSEETVDDDRQGAVTGYVAGGAEGIHGDVEGDHQGIVSLAEAENGAQQS